MERYERYKDSGVKWIGEIPEHWGMYKLKYLFKLNKNKNIGNKCNTILSLSYGKIKIKKDLNEGLTPESYESYQLLSTGDIVIRSTDLQNDHTSLRTGLVKIEGAITSAYIGLKNLDKNLYDSRFYHYFLHDWDITKAIYNQGKGLRQSLNWDDIKNMLIPVLDISEQTAIANYLDSTTAKLDEAIAQQQKMIDLLNERKQIIINNAVTKGLNPDAPMKDSGVDWIGEIPEHWEVMKLKHVTSKIGSGSTPRGGAEVYQDSGIMFLRSQNVYNDGLKLDDVAHIVDGVHQKMKGTQVKYNDILYNITGGSIGRCCCYDREDEANVNQHVSIVRPKGIIAKYLMYNLQSDNAQRQLRETLKGGNREGLAAVTFKEFLILTCPKEEQNQIVSHIERMFVNIDRAISNATKQISLLQERKQIIINDVVTGKVKVS